MSKKGQARGGEGHESEKREEESRGGVLGDGCKRRPRSRSFSMTMPLFFFFKLLVASAPSAICLCRDKDAQRAENTELF